jgi:hypothetical protein
MRSVMHNMQITVRVIERECILRRNITGSDDNAEELMVGSDVTSNLAAVRMLQTQDGTCTLESGLPGSIRHANVWRNFSSNLLSQDLSVTQAKGIMSATAGCLKRHSWVVLTMTIGLGFCT